MVARTVVVAVVLLVAAAAAAAGFAGGYEYRGSPASTPSAVANSTLSILAAGTLDTFFPELADALANETPGIGVPSAAQTYEGSLSVTSAIASLHAPADVAAVADFRLIPEGLEPGHAGYEVVFGGTPEVLVYDPGILAFDGVNASNWAEKLVQDVSTPGNAPFGVWNASTDPNGYNEIFSLELQGLVYNATPDLYYDHFYSGGPGAVAVPDPSTTKIEKEAQAALLVSTGVVSAVITYRAYAVANHLSYVSLDPTVGLAANSSAALADYARLSTTIVTSSGGTTSVAPAPVLFAMTVPSDAPNPALGAAFLHLVLSPEGSALLSAGGAFTMVVPGWADRPGEVPSVLAPDVTAPPPWAAAYLA